MTTVGLMPAIIIETECDVERGAAWLAAREPRFAHALQLTGKLPLRRRDAGFPELLRTICSQQLSVAAAETIWRSLVAAGATRPENLLAMDEAALRACGLSGPKSAMCERWRRPISTIMRLARWPRRMRSPS